MFEAYTRLGAPHRAPGLGLGLYRGARDRDRPRGHDLVTSDVGAGTTFTVRLPAEPAGRRARAIPGKPRAS